MSGPCSRRQLLRQLGVVTAGGIAGCNEIVPSPDEPTAEPSESPTPSPRTTAVTDTPTETPTETETPTDTPTPDGEAPTHLVQTKDLAPRDGGRLPGVFADVVVGGDGILCCGWLDGTIWLAKLDATLDVEWSHEYSAWSVADDRTGFTVSKASNGGYLVGGIRESSEEEVGVFTTGSRGALQWERRFSVGYTGDVQNVWVVESVDGIRVCVWNELTAETAETHVKAVAGPEGSLQWEQTYDTLAAQVVQPSHNGGCFIEGYDLGGDTWIAELEPDGSQRWHITSGKFRFARRTGAGYVLWATEENSVRIRALDDNRQEQWTRTYDLSGSSLAFLEPNAGGGYLLAGEGDEGMWLTVIGSDGDVQSTTKYGVATGERIEPYGLVSTDEQYVVVGSFEDIDSRDNGWVLSVDK